MRRDFRKTEIYADTAALYSALRQPGTGQISDATDVHVSPDGKRAVFSATIAAELEGALPAHICELDLQSGDVRVLTFGPNTDRLPKYSPDGSRVAFLSDREHAGDFQLFLLDPLSGAVRRAPDIDGWVEYFHWSVDGTRILLGVAGRGADLAGVQGATRSRSISQEMPSWMPAVDTGDESHRWRRACLYELASGRVWQVSDPRINVWEAVWCGEDSLAAVVSPGPGEGLWYHARLRIIDVPSGASHEIYTPRDQLGCLAASPSGKRVAIVEAISSDRYLVAGLLHVLDRPSGKIRTVDTQQVDVACTEWRSDRVLLVAGHRGFETVIATFDADSGKFSEVWSSCETSVGGRYVAASRFGQSGDCVLVGESFTRGPEIAVIRSGTYQAVKSLDLGYAEQAKAIENVERVTWNAPDGLEIQGWLLRPKGSAPHSLVMDLHGGPVWHWRPRWLGRIGLHELLLVRRGYAVFLPNPRGSSGRGQDFAQRVVGDMGGADTYDCLSGLDYLVGRGVADPRRLGVTGGSYGGFLTCWLITQDQRFAAAVAVAPVTDHMSEQLLSNLPDFTATFLADTYTNTRGRYFDRSPVMHASRVRTPTLNICGALDRVTPPEQARLFHNALLENGTKSVLITYPEDGHGVRSFPAAIDYTARLVSWFEEHMPAP